MSSISQRTRSKKALRTLSEIDEHKETPWCNSSFYEASGESIDDRLDNLTQVCVDSWASSILYCALHYPRLFIAGWITGITVLAAAVSYAHPCDHSPPVRCYL